MKTLLFAIYLFFFSASISHAICKIGTTEYDTGARIERGGEILECQSDGTWKKVN